MTLTGRALLQTGSDTSPSTIGASLLEMATTVRTGRVSDSEPHAMPATTSATAKAVARGWARREGAVRDDEASGSIAGFRRRNSSANSSAKSGGGGAMRKRPGLKILSA